MTKNNFIRQIYNTDENSKIEMYTVNNKTSFAKNDIKELTDEYVVIETDKLIVYHSLNDVFGIIIYKQTDENKEEE